MQLLGLLSPFFKPHTAMQRAVLSGILLCGLSACSNTDDTSSGARIAGAPAHQTHSHETHSHGAYGANEVSAVNEKRSTVPYQKPGAPVRLVTTKEVILNDLDPMDYIFEFSSAQNSGQLRVEVAASEGLDLRDEGIDDTTRAFVFDLASDELRVPLTISALSLGRHTLTFYLELNGLRRVTGVSIVAVDPTSQSLQKAEESTAVASDSLNTNGALKVVPMKAQETISQ